MKITILTLSAILLCSGFVRAQETREYPSTSGNAYLRFCSAIDKDDKDQTREDFRYIVACIAYAEGVAQGALAESSLETTSTRKEHPAPFCIPSEADNGQMVRITLKYIHKNPEQSHEPTVYLMIWALKEAFPCATQAGKMQ